MHRALQDKLPVEPNLALKTAEEYLARFLEILRAALAHFPPSLPTQSAVDLLVAVAQMQRFVCVCVCVCVTVCVCVCVRAQQVHDISNSARL